MKKQKRLALFTAIIIIASVLQVPVLAEQEVKGYILNTETGCLQEYYTTPEESISDISANETEEVSMTKDSAVMPRAFTRVFQSYSPNTYSYDYDNALFKIVMVRVDN